MDKLQRAETHISGLIGGLRQAGVDPERLKRARRMVARIVGKGSSPNEPPGGRGELLKDLDAE